MMASLLTICSFVLLVGITFGWEKPPCPSGREVNSAAVRWLPDPHDCALFYVCQGSQRFEFTCGENVWDPETKTCVGRGSQWDRCTFAGELNELPDVLQNHPCANSNSGIFVKDNNCAQYYNCSAGEIIIGNDPHLRECPYPQLFNSETKRCEHYDMVECGARVEPLDACEYEANQCSRSAHCTPCEVRFPSCKDLTDGLNPWIGREYSPFYVLCQGQRALYNGQCDNSKGLQLFDPEKRICVEYPRKK